MNLQNFVDTSLYVHPILLTHVEVKWDDSSLPIFSSPALIGSRYQKLSGAVEAVCNAAAIRYGAVHGRPDKPSGKVHLCYLIYPENIVRVYSGPGNFEGWGKSETADDPFMERSGPPSPSSPRSIYAVYSTDDGIVLCPSKAEADAVVEDWIERGAGGVDGPFGPFDMEGAHVNDD